jgi:hypothetical protein
MFPNLHSGTLSPLVKDVEQVRLLVGNAASVQPEDLLSLALPPDRLLAPGGVAFLSETSDCVSR